ncbi:MAG TPA: DUF2877 domain-containing protein, partial [Anaerolineales bacterium]|nr:DUF2877 domain-containing protein [Anaerolineales bacterium]
NLRLEHEDRLITVLISDHYDLPQGIRLGTKHASLPSLTVGLRAASRGGILRFGSSPLCIDLRGAPIWQGRIGTLPITIEQAWSTLWQNLHQQQIIKGTELIAEDLFNLDRGPLLTRKLSLPVRQLITAIKRYDSYACSEAAQKMLGLGPGVTPSGDDVLIGFLAGLHCMAGNEKDKQAFIQTLGNEIRLLSNKTSEISRTYLYHAVKGEFSSSIVALIDAIRDGGEGQLTAAAENAMRVGHSSGMDTVSGLLIGLAAWDASSFHLDHKDMSLWQLHMDAADSMPSHIVSRSLSIKPRGPSP